MRGQEGETALLGDLTRDGGKYKTAKYFRTDRARDRLAEERRERAKEASIFGLRVGKIAKAVVSQDHHENRWRSALEVGNSVGTLRKLGRSLVDGRKMGSRRKRGSHDRLVRVEFPFGRKLVSDKHDGNKERFPDESLVVLRPFWSEKGDHVSQDRRGKANVAKADKRE
jgi:hypothetical protein